MEDLAESFKFEWNRKDLKLENWKVVSFYKQSKSNSRQMSRIQRGFLPTKYLGRRLEGSAVTPVTWQKASKVDWHQGGGENEAQSHCPSMSE